MSQVSSFIFDKVVNGVGLSGLDNLGQTCYINATLQFCFSSRHLQDFFKNDELVVKCLTALRRGQVISLSLSVKELFSQLIHQDSVSPTEFVNTISMLWAGFQKNVQLDACEFLLFLLGTLHHELMTKEVNNYQDSPPDLFTKWDRSSTSAISLLCHIQMVNRVTCTKCDYDSTSFPDASNHLSLDLDNCSSVVDCLKAFCKVTATDGQCPSCKAENCQRIQTQFARIPPLFIIQLKRFRQYAGVKFGKIKQNISFDINLDLAPFMVGDLHSKTDYKLIAVQNHHGDLGHGHYYSLCQRGNRWYKFDDSRVTSMTTRRLVSEHAYLLCYEKPLDREPVLPFDLVSLSDALTSQLSVIPVHPDATPPPADSNNNYHLNLTPDIFKSPEQSLHEAADLLQNTGEHFQSVTTTWEADKQLTTHADSNNDYDGLASPDLFQTQSPPHDKDLSQFVVESTKASVRGNATLQQSNKRKETFSEVRGVKRLPLQSTQQEPHRCEHAPFNFHQSDPVLTEQDVMGAELDVENLGQYHVPELKRWLECRGVRRGTTKQALIKKIEDHVAQGKKDKIDPKVDGGIWVIEKKKKIALENPQDPRGYLPHLPVVGFNMWKPFPSIHIPQKYDYQKIEDYFDNIPEIVFSVAAGVVSRTQDASDDEVFDASLPTPDDRKRKYLTNTLGRGNLFLDSGRILSVYDYEKNGHYFIKSMVHASLMNKVYMTMLTIASFHGDVCNAICTCKANALGRCCHIAAVLLLIHRHIQTAGHEAVTCTGRKCYWIGGETANNRDPGVVREKGRYYTNYKFSRRGYFNPIPTKYQNEEEAIQDKVVQAFLEEIKTLPIRSLFEYQLSASIDDEPCPDSDMTSVISEQCSFAFWCLNSIREVAPDGKPYEIPRTRAQYQSPFWDSERAIRVTASKCKAFLSLTSENALIAYFRKSMWGFKKPPTAAMQLGIENEPLARNKYVEEYMSVEDPGAIMWQTGSWVSPQYPMLICSPDGIIQGTCVTKLFETKYCSILKGADPNDFKTVLTKKQQNSFYLRFVDDKLALKESHPYYYQVQMSLDILQLDTCEFAVLTGDKDHGWKMAVISVPYEESFWREKRQRIIKKHRELVVPEHFLARTVRNLPPRQLYYSDFHENHLDPYFLQGGKQVNDYMLLREEEEGDSFLFC